MQPPRARPLPRVAARRLTRTVAPAVREVAVPLAGVVPVLICVSPAAYVPEGPVPVGSAEAGAANRSEAERAARRTDFVKVPLHYRPPKAYGDVVDSVNVNVFE